MSKRDLIDRIMELNRSARREFLQGFNEGELDDYLRQLETVRTKHTSLDSDEARRCADAEHFGRVTA